MSDDLERIWADRDELNDDALPVVERLRIAADRLAEQEKVIAELTTFVQRVANSGAVGAGGPGSLSFDACALLARMGGEHGGA